VNATPIHDKVAVLYSPASFRIHWLLEQKPDPTAWITRSLDDDDRGNALTSGGEPGRNDCLADRGKPCAGPSFYENS
jgi:hypothetical protein